MKPYTPSCGTEMIWFYGKYCDKCQDPDELAWAKSDIPPGCPHIVAATAEDKQPEPWVIKDGEPCCLDFLPGGTKD